MLENGITNCCFSAFLPLPIICSITISSCVACKSLPSFFESSLKVTSTFLPVFFKYWRWNLKGLSIPGDETSSEKSPS